MTFQQSDIIFLPLASICTKLKLTIKFMTLFFIVSGVTAIGTALSENGGLLNHYFNSLMSYGTLSRKLLNKSSHHYLFCFVFDMFNFSLTRLPFLFDRSPRPLLVEGFKGSMT